MWQTTYTTGQPRMLSNTKVIAKFLIKRFMFCTLKELMYFNFLIHLDQGKNFRFQENKRRHCYGLSVIELSPKLILTYELASELKQ